MSRLESAYRRLIRLYPPEHQRLYGEEMVGVLLADSAPGRLRPRAVEVFDLVVAAVGLRLSSTRGSLQSGQWSRAVGVFGFLAALILVSEHLRPLLGDLTMSRSVRWQGVDGITTLVQLAAWLVAVCSLLAGRRLPAVIASWVAVASSAAWLIGELPHWQSTVIMSWWQHLLVLVCAVALTLAGPPEPVALLGRNRVTVLIVMSVAAGCSAAAGYTLFAHQAPWPLLQPWPWMDPLTASLLLAFGVTIALSLRRLPAPTRRRVLVLFASPFGMLLAAGSRLFDELLGYGASDYGTAGNGIVLAVTSLLLLAFAALYSAHRERRAHLIALGREAEVAAGRRADGQ